MSSILNKAIDKAARQMGDEQPTIANEGKWLYDKLRELRKEYFKVESWKK